MVRSKYAAALFACCLAVAAAMLFAAGAAPPLIHAVQATAENHPSTDFGTTMKSMPGADALVQAPDGPPGNTNPGHPKLTGSILGLIVFGLFLAVGLLTRPRAYQHPPRQGVADLFRPTDREPSLRQ